VTFNDLVILVAFVLIVMRMLVRMANNTRRWFPRPSAWTRSCFFLLY